MDRRVEGEEALSAVDAIATYFKFSERGTTLATEVKAGVTTFMVMAYILFLNPAILSNMVGAPGSPEAAAFIPAAAAAREKKQHIRAAKMIRAAFS